MKKFLSALLYGIGSILTLGTYLLFPPSTVSGFYVLFVVMGGLLLVLNEAVFWLDGSVRSRVRQHFRQSALNYISILGLIAYTIIITTLDTRGTAGWAILFNILLIGILCVPILFNASYLFIRKYSTLSNSLAAKKKRMFILLLIVTIGLIFLTYTHTP